MEFVGEWHRFADGKVRPVLDVSARGADGVLRADRFLLDTGADRTIFSAFFLRTLGLPTTPPPAGHNLEGVGGPSTFALVRAEVAFWSASGHSTLTRGEFAAFLDPAASDHSILGRDLLQVFDVIVSRRRSEVRLLAGVHTYQIVTP